MSSTAADADNTDGSSDADADPEGGYAADVSAAAADLGEFHSPPRRGASLRQPNLELSPTGSLDDVSDDEDDSGNDVDDEDPHNLLTSGLSSQQHRLQARLWSYLMENLHRAVDEIYYMCEHESMASGCTQAAAALTERISDFEQLKERIMMQERFGEGELKSSITWEVQTSPLHAPSLSSADRHGPAAGPVRLQKLRSTSREGSSVERPAAGGDDDAVESSDSEHEGSPGAETHLTIDVPSDEESFDMGLNSSGSTSAAMSTSSRSSKRSPSKRFEAFEKRLLTPERRKKTAEETLREQIEKQERAEKLRSMLLSEKQGKLREAASRAARVTAAQEEQRLKRRLFMDERHEKAEQLHEAHVQAILSKAGKETQKVKEVRFINQMMENNRHLDLKEKIEDRELRRESQLSQNAAKTALEERQAAAQEKRRSMQAERKLKLQEKEERRLQTQQRRALEKEKAQELKDAKAEEVVRRAEIAQTREQQEFERLEHELVTRLNEVSRRKKEYLESIKGKSAADSAKSVQLPMDGEDGLSLPFARRRNGKRRHRREGAKARSSRGNAAAADRAPLTPEHSAAMHEGLTDSEPAQDGEYGSASLAASDLSTHHDARPSRDDLSDTSSARKAKAIPVMQRTRANKRKLRKLRQVLSGMKEEMAEQYGVQQDGWLQVGEGSRTTQRLLNIVRQASAALKHHDERSVEHALQDLSRWIGAQGQCIDEPIEFCHAGGVDILVRLATLTKAGTRQSKLVAAETLCSLVKSNSKIWLAMLLMNHITPFVDVMIAIHCTSTVEEVAAEPTHVTAYKSACTNLISLFLQGNLDIVDDSEPCRCLCSALAEYIVHSRVVPLVLNSLFLVQSATGGTPNTKSGMQPRHVDYFSACLRLLEALSGFHCRRSVSPVFDPPALGADVTSAFTATEIAGILQVLGSVLLEGGPSSSASSAVMNVACTAIACLNNVAREDLALLQSSLGSDMYSVNFLHTVYFLLTQSAETGDWILLDELILFIGYFSLVSTQARVSLHNLIFRDTNVCDRLLVFLIQENERNQAMLHWQKVGESEGQSLLHILCSMVHKDDSVVSDRRRVDVLFPTLIASCYKDESSRCDWNCDLLSFVDIRRN